MSPERSHRSYSRGVPLRDVDDYWAIGRSILEVLSAPEKLDPVWLKIYLRLASLWLVQDIQALCAEFARVDALILSGEPVTAPVTH